MGLHSRFIRKIHYGSLLFINNKMQSWLKAVKFGITLTVRQSHWKQKDKKWHRSVIKYKRKRTEERNGFLSPLCTSAELWLWLKMIDYWSPLIVTNNIN